MSAGADPGDMVPAYVVELTLQRLVMEAAANRDFAPIHFDLESACASGAPGPYANTTFIETLLEAMLRSWAGPAARLRMLEFRMLDFNCAGDQVRAAGVVREVTPSNGGSRVELEIWVDGPRGRTVDGSAVVELAGG